MGKLDSRLVWGHVLPENCKNLDALRLLLGLFWDRSRTVVATYPTDYCIQFMAVSIISMYGYLLSQLTSKFHERRQLTEQQVRVTDDETGCREF